MRPFHTLLNGWRACWRALIRRRRRPTWIASEPADLGTAFGLDAALEATEAAPLPPLH